MNDDRKVSLGCGSLILIALIVMILGNRDRSGDATVVRNELNELQRQVSQLRYAVDEQTKEIAKLRSDLKQQP